MRADDEACDLCGAAAGQPHRLRCTRVIDEQMEAHEFEESAGVQLSLIAGVVSGIVVLLLMMMAFRIGFLLAVFPAAGAGGGVYEILRRIAESRRDAAPRQAKRG